MIGMICLIFLRFGDLVCGEKFSHRAVPRGGHAHLSGTAGGKCW